MSMYLSNRWWNALARKDQLGWFRSKVIREKQVRNCSGKRIGIVPGIISEGIHPKAQVVMEESCSEWLEKLYRVIGRSFGGVRRSSKWSERSSRSAGNKYIVIYINYELILIIKCIYLKAYRGSNFLMGQISDLGPMRESAFWKCA